MSPALPRFRVSFLFEHDLRPDAFALFSRGKTAAHASGSCFNAAALAAVAAVRTQLSNPHGTNWPWRSAICRVVGFRRMRGTKQAPRLCSHCSHSVPAGTQRARRDSGLSQDYAGYDGMSHSYLQTTSRPTCPRRDSGRGRRCLRANQWCRERTGRPALIGARDLMMVACLAGPSPLGAAPACLTNADVPDPNLAFRKLWSKDVKKAAKPTTISLSMPRSFHDAGRRSASLRERTACS
jgi:hypothetical protein